MGKKERIYLYITLLLAAILITKSLFLDEVKDLSGDEWKVKQFVERAVDEKYSGFLKDKGMVKYRVVDIKKIETEGTSTIEYYDPEQKDFVKDNIQGKYQAKVRGYFLHIIPYKEFKVATNNEQ
ncbi:hypothetical protein HNQ80_003554 [Anaerosolibacter carboniphilus]|uniref:DUF3139 domain-containing protein n=1 Tax=Anaerosolibacter carboniphilus TaxID=1417629 RepID=A0A841L545_9FIRM|nr:hypothetical protein [Anaerosolibacter carboniphilus]MBB6217435.1 hypothetical protein [Anaerosolibacter carboniphilus]